MSVVKYRKILALIMILGTMFGTAIGLGTHNAQASTPIYFNVTILCPTSIPARIAWATIIELELEKIGIGVEIVFADWSEINQRIWGYPGPYPIPTHAEGGYDMLFVGWDFGFEIDLSGLYDTSSVTPDGGNFYQYSNQEMDWAISNHSQSYDPTERQYWAHQLQTLAYEDLPSIAILYAEDIYPMNEDINGFNAVLWDNNRQLMSDWQFGTNEELRFAVSNEFNEFFLYSAMLDTLSRHNRNWLSQIYTSLIMRDNQTYDWIPHLASTISTEDHIEYNIELDTNAKWADGEILNATDIAFSYQLYEDVLQYNSWFYWDLFDIEIINEFELKITMLNPSMYNLNYLSIPIMPEHIWKDVSVSELSDTAYNWVKTEPEKIFGAGPYKLAEYDETNGIMNLTKNSYYADLLVAEEPIIDNVIFEKFANKDEALLALEYGLTDIIDSRFFLTAEDIDIPGVKIITSSVGSVQELAINHENPYFGTGEFCPISGLESAKNIRKAISHVIPRKSIIDNLLDGYGSPGITLWPENSLDFDETLVAYEYDLDLARDYMRLVAVDPWLPNSSSNDLGPSLPIYLAIISLIGGTIVISRKRTKQKR